MTEHYDEVPSGEFRMSPEVRAMLEGRAMRPAFDFEQMREIIDRRLEHMIALSVQSSPRFTVRNVTPVPGDNPNEVVLQIDGEWGFETRANGMIREIEGYSLTTGPIMDESHSLPFTEDYAGEDIEINGERFYYIYPTQDTPGRLMPLDPDVLLAEYRQPMLMIKDAPEISEMCVCYDRQIWTAPVEGVDDELVKPYAWL